MWPKILGLWIDKRYGVDGHFNRHSGIAVDVYGNPVIDLSEFTVRRRRFAIKGRAGPLEDRNSSKRIRTGRPFSIVRSVRPNLSVMN